MNVKAIKLAAQALSALTEAEPSFENYNLRFAAARLGEIWGLIREVDVDFKDLGREVDDEAGHADVLRLTAELVHRFGSAQAYRPCMMQLRDLAGCLRGMGVL